MNTATLETPPAVTGELPITIHEFNASGLCLEPERITVTMPKGGVCELRLAYHVTDRWLVGYRLAAGQEGALDVYPTLGQDSHPDRAAALEAALKAAIDFFAASPKSKLHQRCAFAVEVFAQKLAGVTPAGPGLAANKAAKAKPGPLPEPQNVDLPVARLEANPHNPRGAIAPAEVAELAATIKAQGLLQPVGVRRIPAADSLPGVAGDGRLELLWGHRRLEAFRSLGRETIPCRVYEGITDEQARLVISIENDERQDLDPIKRAKGYADMMRDFELTQDDVATALKKSRPVIANALRLLELPATVQDLLAQGKLTTAHGTALCRFKAWPKACTVIAEACFRSNLSTSAIENELQDDAITDNLEDGKTAVLIRTYDFPNGRMPEQFKGDPDFIKNGNYSFYCFAPDKWKAYKAERAAAEKAEQTKHRQQMSAARTADKGTPIEPAEAYLAELLPADKVGKKGGKLVCTDTRLWQMIRNEAQGVRSGANADRMRTLANDALAELKKTKTITGPLAAVLFFDDEFDFYPSGSDVRNLGGKLAQSLGLKFAAAKEANARLLASEPLALLKMQIGARLDSIAKTNSTYMSEESCRILAGVLGLEKPGTIEETAEGRAQIVAALRKKLKLPAPAKSKKFEWGSAGTCTNPDVVKLPMPAGAECEISVAQSPDGRWRSGIKIGLTVNAEGIATPVRDMNGGGSDTRELALSSAAQNAEAWFLNKKGKIAAKAAGICLRYALEMGRPPNADLPAKKGGKK